MKPRLLDLFCGAGGAAMGYHEAGFEVVGVDNQPQPYYPFEFVQADAFDALKHCSWFDFAAIHASPPCHDYTSITHIPDGTKDLLPRTLKFLKASGVPYYTRFIGTQLLSCLS